MTATMSKCELMEQISKCEFVLVDINLFLDTHPDNERAIADYNGYAEQLHAMKKMYVENYGPLHNFGNSMNRCDSKWLWNEMPFPWQRTEV